MRLWQGPPVRADFKPCHKLPINTFGCLIQLFFHHYEQIGHHYQSRFMLEPRAYLNFLGQVPCSFLIWSQSIDFSTLREICDPNFEFHFPWNESIIPSRRRREVRSGRLVYEQTPGLFTLQADIFVVDDDDMDSDTVAESDMSLKSRSFLHRANDRVRKMQGQSSKDATQDSNKHSLIW